MRYLYLALCMIFFSWPAVVLGQQMPSVLSKLHANFDAETPQGNSYKVFVFQHRKSWSLLIDYGQNNILSFDYDLKTDQIKPNSELFTTNLIAIINKKLIKAKQYKKERLISDMPIKGKYKLHRKGKGVYESMLFMETGKKPTPWVVKAALTLIKPFTFVFDSHLKKAKTSVNKNIQKSTDTLLIS
ncbi:hypothetical protein [Persicobacter psychrovividus]|uniref:Ribosome association toxin RatA n=1 Tax=Persicobacter psychrovividus TaxID=387638 RepID=A0ABM7VK42_9BACT|nr:hypothetical protein PEPS_36220 [Persicobacter psychrovividus]